MKQIIRVVVDAMGGDNAPSQPIKAAAEAVKEREDIEILLVGQEEVIQRELKQYQIPEGRIRVIPASEVIEMGEPPVNAIRRKKDSSMVVGMKLVKQGEADAFISSGSTGAVLVGGQLVVGRIRGIERPPLAPLIPTEHGVALLIDCGANVDARASHLVQFAKMGSIYMENVMGVKNPRVGLVNIGAEEEKGNALVKETFPLLKKCEDINFIGNVEARDIPAGVCDVVVCEAFVGNVILKLYEGVGKTMMTMIKNGMMTNTRSKVGALLVKPALKETLKAFDATQYGGAPLLGLNGLVVKTHGSAKSGEIKNAIAQCVQFTQQQINAKIKENLIIEKKQEEP
ncbi:MAG: phosphate acyltransferase PlsX [Eubacteriales bacterium]|nr:phosphate acyltransferase PlsX [Eubacteriales bacterium]